MQEMTMANYLVFPATVLEVEGATVKLLYDDDGEGQEGWENMHHVTPRICMPWHPKYLKGEFSIMLRRQNGMLTLDTLRICVAGKILD